MASISPIQTERSEKYMSKSNRLILVSGLLLSLAQLCVVVLWMFYFSEYLSVIDGSATKIMFFMKSPFSLFVNEQSGVSWLYWPAIVSVIGFVFCLFSTVKLWKKI